MTEFPPSTALIPVFIPLLNPSELEATLISIAVHEGQAILLGDPLATIQAKHSAGDVTSPATGFVVGIQYAVGQKSHFGEVLCYIAGSPQVQPPLSAGQSADPKALIVFGGGGHGKAVIDLVRVLSGYRLAGIVDDQKQPGEAVLGVPVLGNSDALGEIRSRGIPYAVNAVGGIGNIAVRVGIFERLAQAGYGFPALVHPTAFVEPSGSLSPGVQLFPHAYVGSDAHVGFGVILNTGVIISHDCRIGAYTNISPGTTLAGEVSVGEKTLIGMGVTINNRVNIGPGARIGNGATVKRDVPAGAVVRAGKIWPEP